MDPPGYQQTMDALRYILDHYAVVSLCDPLFGSVFGVPVQEGDSCGHTSLRILPDGSVTPSTYLITPEWRSVTLQKDLKLSEIASLPEFRRIIETPVPDACKGCPTVNTCCGGAVDRRILTYSSLGQRDPYCPFVHGDTLHQDQKVRLFTGASPSVHDGYLPTMIFSPEGE